MIKAEGAGLRYPDGTVALKGINLQIGSGELVYITGRSGSGKTSLLKLFMGMEYPTEGKVTILGQPIEKGCDGDIRRLRMRIGPVFQEFRLIDGRTALENVMLGMRFLDMPLNRIREDASLALEKVGLAHKMYSHVENMSWGERQRVAIARAVARKPALILADEPTGNLDRENAIKIFELLDSFRNKDTSVIITTHATHLLDTLENAVHISIEDGSIKPDSTGVGAS